jgi:hypothetical protein
MSRFDDNDLGFDFSKNNNEEDDEQYDNEDLEEDEEDEEEDEDEEEKVHYNTEDINPVLTLIAVDPEKAVSERFCIDPNENIPANCLSKYYVGKEIARGSQSVILEACQTATDMSCKHIIRIVNLIDENSQSLDPKQNERGKQFLRDVYTRRYIKCNCPQLPILELTDVFMCRKVDQKVYGVAVAPKLSGNILDYLYSLQHPRQVIDNVNEALERLIRRMHLSCFLVHRDISYQNILYTANSSGNDLVLFLTDFESAYIEPENTRTADETSREYDAYKNADNQSVQKTMHELTDLADLLEAKNANDTQKMAQIWNRLSSFVKSDLLRRDSRWQELEILSDEEEEEYNDEDLGFTFG